MAIDVPKPAVFGPIRVARSFVSTTREGMQRDLPAALDRVTRVLREQDITPTGAWFAHYKERPAGRFEFDVCFPMEATLVPAEHVDAGEIGATPVVRSAHRGSYAGLPGAWRELHEFVRAAGIATGEEFFEVYTINPGQTPDPAEWVTELNLALAATQGEAQ